MESSVRSIRRGVTPNPVRSLLLFIPALMLAAVFLCGAGNDSSANKLCDQADQAAGVGNYDEAIALYNRAIKADEKLSRAYLNRGIALDQIDKCEQALKDFDKALSLCSSNDKFRQEFLYNRGMCLHRLGRYKDAIRDYDEAIKIKTDCSYHFMRGKSYRALGQPDKALNDFDAAAGCAEGDERAMSLFHRGLAYRDLGKNEKALDDFNQSIIAFERDYDGKDPAPLRGSKHNLPAAYWERGHLYDKLGKKELAANDLKRAEQFNYRPDIEHRLPVKIDQ